MEQSIYDNPERWILGCSEASITTCEDVNNDFLVAEGITFTEQNEGGNEQFILAAGYSGATESDIGYAVGIENRFESGFYTPDELTQSGDSTAAQQDATEGDYSVQSIYGEVSIPVTDAFTVEAATRFDNYSTFGGATTWKLGATYRFSEGFMIRSVAAT